MGISRQIGWTEKEKLLYEISNKLKRANSLAYKWTQGDFYQGSTNEPVTTTSTTTVEPTTTTTTTFECNLTYTFDYTFTTTTTTTASP